MPITVRQTHPSDAAAISLLVQTSFLELAATDWEVEGRQFFLEQSSEKAMEEKLKMAVYSAGAFENDEMIGFILMPSAALLGMLFVHPQRLRQGVATALWDRARQHIETHFTQIKTVELNATPYAVRFYRSIGFNPISAEFKRDGCTATRMACWFPAKGVGAAVT